VRTDQRNIHTSTYFASIDVLRPGPVVVSFLLAFVHGSVVENESTGQCGKDRMGGGEMEQMCCGP
jgi:hypothetical protein